jgi:hypothetical protein
MLMVLLPVAIALCYPIGMMIDPGRTLFGALIGVKDLDDRRTIHAALLLSLACTLIYLAIFGWRFAGVADFLFWSVVVGPALSIYMAIATNWTRRVGKQYLGGA